MKLLWASLLGTSSGSNVFSLILVLAVIAWVIYRQVRPRRLYTRTLIIIPLLILFFIAQSFSSFNPTVAKIEEMIITSVVSIVFGLLACRSLHVYASPTSGKAMAESSWTYFLWWLASFVVKGGLALAFGETSLTNLNPVEILLPLLLLLIIRNAYLYWRATQLGLALH